MTIHILHLDTRLVADGLYDVSVRGRPGIVPRTVSAPNATEAILRAAAALAVAVVVQDQN